MKAEEYLKTKINLIYYGFKISELPLEEFIASCKYRNKDECNAEAYLRLARALLSAQVAYKNLESRCLPCACDHDHE